MKLLIWNLKILVGSSRNLAKHWEVEAKFSTCLYESLHITEISKCVSGIFDFNNWNAEQEEWRAYYGERGAINLERGVQEFWREGYRSSGERSTGVLERGAQKFWREGYRNFGEGPRNSGERSTWILERGAQEFWREGHMNSGERGTGTLDWGVHELQYRNFDEFIKLDLLLTCMKYCTYGLNPLWTWMNVLAETVSYDLEFLKE